MNSHATLVHHRCWRLILAIATDNGHAQRMLAREVGDDPKAWHQIALATALMTVQLLDEKIMTADTDLADPDITARARDHTIGRIERCLADALDTPADG